jgi:hypothetical protein
MLLYAIVFAIGVAGMTQLSWWAAALGGCVLSLTFTSEDRTALHSGVATWEAAQIASNFIISATASVLAFGAGRVIAVMWGL